MELDGQLHALVAAPPRKELPVPLGQEAGWAPELAHRLLTIVTELP